MEKIIYRTKELVDDLSDSLNVLDDQISKLDPENKAKYSDLVCKLKNAVKNNDIQTLKMLQVELSNTLKNR